MTALVDTGFLYALLNRSEARHDDVTLAFAQTTGPWYLPSPALTEIAYLVAKYQGQEDLALFLGALPRSKLIVLEPEMVDYGRCAELTRQYHDTPLDFVDAFLISLAERLDVRTVLTLDQRHFRLVRPSHCAALTILP